MNDRGGMTLSEEEVEERLRRTLATRVGDMGAGNGVLLPPPAADTDADADAGSDGGDRRRRLVLAVAATLLVAAGVAAAALAAVAGTDEDRDPDDRGSTRVADDPSTTTTSPQTTTTSAPAADGSSCVVLSLSQGEDRWITVVFDPTPLRGSDIDVAGLLGDQWRPVEAGPNRGYMASVEPGSPALWLLFDEGVVRLQGGGVTGDELIAVGATVTRDPSGCYTAPTPDGWSREETPLPPAEGGGRRNPDGDLVALFDNAAGGSYNVIWYPAWADDLPDGVEGVAVSDGQAYVGTVAPASDLLQLWIVYDDGVVELQASGLSRDELVAAGNGVHRRAGTDEFDIDPAPGFTRQE